MAGHGESAERLERQLTILMAARLALAIASLGIALALEAAGGNITITEWHGFYGAVVVAFVATLVYRPFLGRIRRPRVFAAVNIATDIGIVSTLVLFSGGKDSVFVFLYMAVAIYAAMFFRRGAAIGWGAAAGLAYGAVLVAGQRELQVASPAPVLFTVWAVHSGALVLVAALTSFLARELERAGRALDERTSDLVRLLTLHQRTVESLRSGLLTTDERGRVTSFNPEAERITGEMLPRALRRDVEEILPGVRDVIHEVGGLGPRGRARMPYKNLRGEELFLGVGTYILRDAAGAPAGHVVIFQDVSDVVEMERELSRSERLAAVGELSASIAHEIRNPLAAISGSIEVMRAKQEGRTAESARLMDIVVREVDRLNQLIGDFLHFARPGPLAIGPVRLGEIVEEVIEMFEAARPAEVDVAYAVDDDLAVSADASALRQVLWNLVLNASQAMPDGGMLCVDAHPVQDDPSQDANHGGRREAEEKAMWVEVAVMDQGVGISAEAAERVFDPFYTTRPGGTGLGLATVHRIVDDHGGLVRLERGCGDWSTVVRVILPRAEAA
jgi:two-component system sensor histidine kinase PilS (NtrC family)